MRSLQRTTGPAPKQPEIPGINGLRLDLKEIPRGRMPRLVRPMLATPVNEPFDKPGWLYEVKWDGYRAIAEIDRRGVSFYSRNFLSFVQRFAPIVRSLRSFDREAVLDGEVVVVDDNGKSHFQLLQNYQKTGEGRLRYYVFDLLYLDGRDLRGLPLAARKQFLGQIVKELPDVLVSEHVEENGVAFFEAALTHDLEGIIAKDGASPYREGVRGNEWLKVKAHHRQEAVIGGFTEPRGRRRDLGALVLGVYEDDEFVYIGHTGGGFDTRGLADMRRRLDPLVQEPCPFTQQPATNGPVHWVKPKLVCEVRFHEWTGDGVMRQPIFLGLREDVPPRAVHRERPKEVVPTNGERLKHSRPKRVNGVASVLTHNGVHRDTGPAPEPSLTNLGKIYWPKEGYAKGDVMAYYREVAPVLLPYLRDRPQSLHCHPNGIAGKSFFQKDVSRQPPPDWVKTVTIDSESGSESTTYLLCQNEPSLLYVVNLGCIELNPWNARVPALENPDYAVIDLDPEDEPFNKVIEATLAVRRTLERAGAEGFCKTSGKRGLHIVVPLGARYSHEQARQFAEIIANLVHQKMPGHTSVVRSPALRQHRIYLDYLQNRRGQTLAAPYSVRPYPGATVSTPLRWSEVRKGLDPAKFTLRTLPKRLEELGDLWAPVLGPGIDLSACLARFVPLA